MIMSIDKISKKTKNSRTFTNDQLDEYTDHLIEEHSFAEKINISNESEKEL